MASALLDTVANSKMTTVHATACYFCLPWPRASQLGASCLLVSSQQRKYASYLWRSWQHLDHYVRQKPECRTTKLKLTVLPLRIVKQGQL